MIRALILLTLFLTAAVLAQDESADGASAEEAASDSAPDVASEPADEEDDGVDIDRIILGGSEDHSQEDDDVFVPTDEISYQQSIPFPTDI